MSKSVGRRQAAQAKRARKRAAMERPGRSSNYARKSTFLNTHSFVDAAGNRIVPWGSDFPHKPWKS